MSTAGQIGTPVHAAVPPSYAGTAGAAASPQAARSAAPRRVKLSVSRVDPWSVMTLGAFLYNVCSSLVGGLQLTLTDD